MIYIASPYSDPSDAVRYDRFIKVRNYANNLMTQGRICFSPIAYGRQFEKEFGAPATFEHWSDFNDYMLLSSNRLHILKLPGWEQSRGVQHEIALAESHGIETLFVELF